MYRHFKNGIGALALLGVLAYGPSASAIGRHTLKPLPHLGSGGQALGLIRSTTGKDPVGVVGTINDAQGNTHACLWRLDGSGGFTLTLLPDIPGGGNSQASMALQNAVQNESRVVGSGQGPGGVRKPVLWTQATDGSFTPHVLPTLGGGDGGAVSAFVGVGDSLTAGVIGTSRTPSGDMHATLWHQYPNGFHAVDLGTLGGRNSRAWDGDYGFDGVGIVGSAQTASGDWHACAWDLHNDGTFGISDRHPGGVSSAFASLDGKGNDVCVEEFMAGTATTPTGKSVGFFDFDHNITQLNAPGFKNTSAQNILATLYGNLTLGSAWNDSAKPHAVAWNTLADLGQTRGYPLSALVDHPIRDDIAFIVSKVGPGTIVGSYIDTGTTAGIRIPIALIADGTRLPDGVVVTQGSPENNFSETDLWRSGDGNTLRIRTQDGAASVQIYNLGDTATHEIRDLGDTGTHEITSLTANLSARVIGNADPSARAEILVYNFTTNIWDSAGFTVSGEVGATIVCTIPAVGHLNPTTGEVRARVNFTPLSGKVRSVEIDTLLLSSN